MNGNVPSVSSCFRSPLKTSSLPWLLYQSRHKAVKYPVLLPFFPCQTFLSYIHMHTGVHTLWKEKNKRSIRAHCVSDNHGTVEGTGTEKCPPIADHNFIHATVLKQAQLHARTWNRKRSVGALSVVQSGGGGIKRRTAHLGVCLMRDEHGSPCLHPLLLMQLGSL